MPPHPPLGQREGQPGLLLAPAMPPSLARPCSGSGGGQEKRSARSRGWRTGPGGLLPSQGPQHYVLTEYSRVTDTYWMMLYKAINLNTQKEVIKAARPSLGKEQNPSSRVGRQHWAWGRAAQSRGVQWVGLQKGPLSCCLRGARPGLGPKATGLLALFWPAALEGTGLDLPPPSGWWSTTLCGWGGGACLSAL